MVHYNSIIIVMRMIENINNEYINIIKIIMMYTYVKVYIYIYIYIYIINYKLL